MGDKKILNIDFINQVKQFIIDFFSDKEKLPDQFENEQGIIFIKNEFMYKFFRIRIAIIPEIFDNYSVDTISEIQDFFKESLGIIFTPYTDKGNILFGVLGDNIIYFFNDDVKALLHRDVNFYLYMRLISNTSK